MEGQEIDKGESLSLKREKLLDRIGVEIATMKRDIYMYPKKKQKAIMADRDPEVEGEVHSDEEGQSGGTKKPVPDKPPIIRFPGCPFPSHKLQLPPLPIDAEVITCNERSAQVVALLEREKILAVAMEGVNVGKEGPLTLVQIGLLNGKVYIFDVLENRELFWKGRLRLILQNQNILKVAYNCCSMSAALNYQFATNLENVFDAQVAHLVIEEHIGRRLPTGLKLSEMCLQYGGNKDKYYTYDWRTDSKIMWMTTVGNFWAMRPLTPDMIEFAAGDVIILVPDVYREQQEYIDANGLTHEFKWRMQEELQIEMDDVVKGSRDRRLARQVTSILQDMSQKYDDRTQLFNVLDPDEINALGISSFDDAAKISPVVSNLKAEQILQELKETELKMRMGEENWEMRTDLLDVLRYYCKHPDGTVKEKAGEVLQLTHVSILETLGRKYNENTTPQMLSCTEREALLMVPYVDMETDTYPTIVTSLYWQLMEEEVHGLINMLRMNPSTFSLTAEGYQQLDYFASGSPTIPEPVSSLAAGLLATLHVYHSSKGNYSIGHQRRQPKKV